MNIPVYLNGNRTLLSDNEFVAEGGEGKIYLKGSYVVKVYHDGVPMIAREKIEELKVLDNEHIIRPQDMVFDKGGKPVGYTMRAVTDTESLASLFTSDYQARNGVTPDMIVKLVGNIREVIASVHLHDGYLIVDGNEFNLLVDEKTLVKPYFIDVDSYQTPSFPARVIMPSIRDWSVEPKNFSPLSDWFSFAVIATQLFIGMHPYKGRHPKLGKGNIKDRMLANASIFGSGVRLPPAARSFDLIPQSYKDWLTAVLENGERMPPPQLGAGGAIIQTVLPSIQALVGSEVLTVELIAEFESILIDMLSAFGAEAYLTADSIQAGRTTISRDGFEHLVVSSKGTFLSAKVENGVCIAKNIQTGETLTLRLAAEEMMSHEGRVYVKNAGRLTEIRCVETGGRTLLSPGNSWDVLPHATRLFQGVVVQSVLGNPHVSVFPETGKCHQFYLPDLKGSKVVDAKYGGGVLAVSCHKDGAYHELLVRMSSDGRSYDARWTSDIDLGSIQFVVLESGIVVRLIDQKLEVFSSKKGAMGLKEINDSLFENADVQLHTDGQRILLSDGKKLYRISMRS